MAAGKKAGLRFIEFFTANIRNANTRRAYHRACCDFFRWCESRGLELEKIGPVHVAAYIEKLQRQLSRPSVKLQLAAIRMLFDWLVVGQVVPFNPASSVRGPRFSTKKGKTPVLSADEARARSGGRCSHVHGAGVHTAAAFAELSAPPGPVWSLRPPGGRCRRR